MKRARKLGPPKRYAFSYAFNRTADSQPHLALHFERLYKSKGLPKVVVKHTHCIVIYNMSLRRIK